MIKKIALVGSLTVLPLNVVHSPMKIATPETKIQMVVAKTVKPKPKIQHQKTAPKKKVIKKTHIKMEVTGYTAGYESTQKQKGDPAYGITASGKYVKQGRTIAMGKNIPFGTKVYIPYFKGKDGFGDGVFTVEDRGGAIGAYNIDVYYDDVQDAIEFGRNTLDVYIIGGK